MMNQKESGDLIQEDLSSNSPHSLDMISVTVAPFTGGPFLLRISKRDSVEELKKAVAKKLKVLKDRICLLYRESQLSDGTLEDNFVSDGARITLLPRAETGLLAQKPEQSVMQALESLNDSQVNDFLSGKAPLNLTMRLGDHMMLIQLQLSTVNAVAAASVNGGNKRSRSSLDSKWSQPGATGGGGAAGGCSSSSYRPKLDTRALAEASKNLTQTLKQLSSEVLTNKPSAGSSHGSESDEIPCKRQRMSATPSPPRRSSSSSREFPQPSSTPLPSFSPSSTPRSPSSGAPSTASKPQSNSASSKPHSKNGGGAIIESMHHHGKGVYSGTFSGTLNPALQDKNGQPKRDITTIIHILNDLLCAQYKNYNHQGTGAPGSNAPRKTDKCANERMPQAETPTQAGGGNPSGESHRSKMEQLQVTRDKMEHLRRVMEERKAMRRARREARSAPYSTSWSLRSSPEENTPSDDSGEKNSSSASATSSSPSSVVSPSAPPPSNAPDSQIYEPETVTA